ncbi:S8 family peptidase [bacterium]|nr:S8 family peptidase [bacterium]
MKVFRLLTISLMLLTTIGYAQAEELGYVDGVLLVRFGFDVNPTTNTAGFVTVGDADIDNLFQRYGATEAEYFFGDLIIRNEEYANLVRNDYKLSFPIDSDMYAIAEEFEKNKRIEWAIPDYLLPIDDYTPNDPSLGSQWWLRQIDAARAWSYQTGDREIIVGAIDTGIDWRHPDLVPNLWVNPGEDLDDDPRPFGPEFPDLPGTIGDWNLTDDDGNGLSDDFLGYDWVTVHQNQVVPGEDAAPQDNNPLDFNGHGTGCNAAMAEAGDNGIGGAGIAYNCKIMSLRAGYSAYDNQGFESGYTQTQAGITALVYATEMGCDVINMSYGGGTRITAMENAINNAWNNGMLLFGASGNDNRNTIQYPANYDHVITVGATNSNDGRANFSNWGDWVEIAAPGVGCYTAWYNHGNPNPSGYTSWDGTSVATPIAAGVGALVMSQYPNLNNTQWREIIMETTDPITPDHYIGTGRVNAYKAVTQNYWPEFSVTEFNISDPDGNGHPDIGETIEVTLSITNANGWMDADNVFASISFDLPGIQIDNNNVLIAGLLRGGQEADNMDDPLRFTVPEGYEHEGAFANMRVTITSNPNDYEITIREKMVIGIPELLLVDDDGGDTLEYWIQQDLSQRPFLYYHHYDLNVLAAPLTADYLSEYNGVIWMTGNAVDPLDDDEVAAIQGAMDNGVNFVFTGEGLDDQLSGTDFYADYLHAESGEGNTVPGLAAVEGAGVPIIPGSSVVITGPGGAGNTQDPDVIVPINGAMAGYTYTNTENVAVIYYEGAYKLLYMACNFEAISGAGMNTRSRSELLYGYNGHPGIISWFDINDVEMEGSTEALPSEFAIESAYPNPFNPATTIQIAVPQGQKVSLRVFDLLGREVATLKNGTLSAGNHTFVWNAAEHAAGIYFAVLEADGVRQTKKLAFVK